MYVCGVSCMNVYGMYTVCEVCVCLCMYGGVCVVIVRMVCICLWYICMCSVYVGYMCPH